MRGNCNDNLKSIILLSDFLRQSIIIFYRWGGYTVNPFHQQDKQWFEDRRRRINDRIYGTEVKDRFLFSFFFFFLFIFSPWTHGGWREARERKGKDAPFERNSLSWLHAVRISLQRRIIQIIASEMIISDDHATVDLAALK